MTIQRLFYAIIEVLKDLVLTSNRSILVGNISANRSILVADVSTNQILIKLAPSIITTSVPRQPNPITLDTVHNSGLSFPRFGYDYCTTTSSHSHEG